MITSIQIRDDVKKALSRFKQRDNESYEEVIINLIHQINNYKKQQETLLIEGYKEMSDESLKISKEFDKIDEDTDWEWK